MLYAPDGADLVSCSTPPGTAQSHGFEPGRSHAVLGETLRLWPTPSIRVLICVALAGSLIACLSPSGQRPGLRLSGEVVAGFPVDWSFANEHREAAIEVHTPYGIPHSVTIWCASTGKRLYVGARNPETKNWPGWVAKHPDVRIRFGRQIYEVRLSQVDDPEVLADILAAYATKYSLSNPPATPAPPVRYWEVVARS